MCAGVIFLYLCMYVCLQILQLGTLLKHSCWWCMMKVESTLSEQFVKKSLLLTKLQLRSENQQKVHFNFFC